MPGSKHKFFIKSLLCIPIVASGLHAMPAHAISTGCNNIAASNFTSAIGTNTDTLGPFNFEAGEQLTVNATASINIDMQITVDGQTQTILNNTSGSLVFTINNTAASTIVLNTINSASRPNPINWNPSYTFTCVAASSDSSSSSSDTTSARQSVDRNAGQAQLDVVSTNIAARIANIGSPAGIGRRSPSGVGRTLPGGGGLNVPAPGAPAGTGGETTNLTGFGSFRPSEMGTRRLIPQDTSFRNLALLASFDSSTMAFAAAGDNNAPDGPDAVRSRKALATERPLTVWGYGSFTSLENDRNNNTGDLRYDGDVWGYNLGMDYTFMPGVYAGVSLGYSETDLTTTYNSGTYNENNLSVTPYAVLNLNTDITVSFLGGYSIGDQERERDTGITSSTDTDMWFAATTASYRFTPNEESPFALTANASILGYRKTTDAYTESDGTTVEKSTGTGLQIKPGLEASYMFEKNGTVLQPFAKVDFVFDLRDTTNDDSNAYDVGGGMRFGNTERGLSGSFEGQTVLGRNDYSEYSVSGLVSYSFDIDSIIGAGQASLAPYVRSNYFGEAQSITSGLDYREAGATLSLALTHVPAHEKNSDTAVISLNARLDF